MKKYIWNFCAAFGGCLIGFWARSLDTIIGCLLFTLGIILLVGSLISENRKNKGIYKRKVIRVSETDKAGKEYRNRNNKNEK